VTAGERVMLGRIDSEWTFIWCTNSNGNSGWIPISAYSTRELAVSTGEVVITETTESGWSWVPN